MDVAKFGRLQIGVVEINKISYLLAVLVVLVAFQAIINAQAAVEKPKMNVAILIYDGVEIIDYTGPYEVLGSWGRRKVYTVASTSKPITTNMGMQVIPNYSFDNQPKADIIVIPGGGKNKVNLLKNDPTIIKWIQDSAKDAKYVLSVCNGAFFLAKTGLLDGLEATTIAGLIENLRAEAPKTRIVTNKRYVDNGKIIVTAGLSSGIDGSLYLVSKLDGEGWAQAIALSLEYNWDPDSKFTRMALADKKLPRSIYEPFDDNAEPIKFVSKLGMSDEKYRVDTALSASEMHKKIDEKWSAEAKWTKTTTKAGNFPRARSVWKFTDEQGQVWNATVNVESTIESKALLVSLKMSRNETGLQKIK